MARIENFDGYLAGGMTGLTQDEQVMWRKHVKKRLESCECDYKVKVCNPVDYFNFQEKLHETEREVMEFDLHKVRTSNLIIISFNAPQSLGTMAEIAIAYEHRIPVIGLNEKGLELHPWQVEMCARIFDDMGEMLDYVESFYLK